MRLALRPHPDFPSTVIAGIEVEAELREGGVFALRYEAIGAPHGLSIPGHAAPGRADELWRTTCFEAFLKADGEPSYFEFNLSPSRRWAAYRFGGYREVMTNVEVEQDPSIVVEARADRLILAAELETDALAELASSGTWRLGLSAVIEAGDGSKSYWALAHPPGKPDFHHGDSFALEISAHERT